MSNEHVERPASDQGADVGSRKVPPRDRHANAPLQEAEVNEKPVTSGPPELHLTEAPKSKDVHTLGDLIRYAYGRAGQRVSKAVSREVGDHLDLDGDMRDELRLRARTDTLLRVPWQLMAAVLREQPGQELLVRVTEVVAIAIREHPVLAGGREDPSPNTHPNASSQPDPVSARKKILAGLNSAVSGGVGPEYVEGREAVAAAASLPDALIKDCVGHSSQLTPSDITEFKTNLVNTLAVLFASGQSWPTSVLLDVLYRNLWRPLAETESDPPSLTLTAKPEPAVATHVAEAWMDRTEQAHRREVEARQDADRMSRHATRLQQQIDQAQMERLDLEAEVQRLLATREELLATLAERERRLGDTKAHASHDYEMLRTNSIQRAQRELALLEEGLHALTRDDPKLHVTRDRVERAIEGLEKELDRLKGEAGV